MALFDDLYDYLTADMRTEDDKRRGSVHNPQLCTCIRRNVTVYSEQIEAWVCCVCEGIVPDDMAGNAK